MSIDRPTTNHSEEQPDEEQPDEEQPDEEQPDEEQPDEEQPDEEQPDNCQDDLLSVFHFACLELLVQLAHIRREADPNRVLVEALKVVRLAQWTAGAEWDLRPSIVGWASEPLRSPDGSYLLSGHELAVSVGQLTATCIQESDAVKISEITVEDLRGRLVASNASSVAAEPGSGDGPPARTAVTGSPDSGEAGSLPDFGAFFSRIVNRIAAPLALDGRLYVVFDARELSLAVLRENWWLSPCPHLDELWELDRRTAYRARIMTAADVIPAGAAAFEVSIDRLKLARDLPEWLDDYDLPRLAAVLEQEYFRSGRDPRNAAGPSRFTGSGPRSLRHGILVNASSRPDGPCGELGFCYRGVEFRYVDFRKLRGVATRLLDHLWRHADRDVLIADLAGPVFKDPHSIVDKHTLRVYRTDFNAFFKKCGIPCRIKIRGDKIRIWKNPGEMDGAE